MSLCYAVSESFSYRRRLEHGTQTPVQSLTVRPGSRHNFALLMNGAVRSLGLAARVVAGYIYVADPMAAPRSEEAPNMPVPGLSSWSRLDRARSDERHRRQSRSYSRGSRTCP